MATRRDQLQSYQFLNQRVISAFVMRETDPAQSPLRRGIGAVFAGVMITVLVGAVFGVYGLLTKIGSGTWKVDGSVVVERETGASFVYLGGALHPTLNYASALLAAGKPGLVAVRVSSASLAGVPRGVIIGIPGAPNSLPPASRAVHDPWTTCSAGGTDSSGAPAATVTLAVGRGPTGARAIVDQGVLVKDVSTRGTYLIWRGHRYQLMQPAIVVPALFGATAGTVTVGTAWLDALPAGADIGPINIPERGTASTAVPGRKVGDVLVAQSGTTPSYYLVFADGIAPITELQKDILAGQFAVHTADTTVSAANATRHSTRLAQPSGDAAPPPSPPTVNQPATGDLLCAQSAPGGAFTLSAGGTVDQLGAAIPTAGRTADGTVLADQVLVPPGSVAVVRAVPVAGTDAGAYYLVTDLGFRYAVPSDTVLQVLGYNPGQAVDVPANLLTRIPPGPALDPAAAVQPAGPGGDPAPGTAPVPAATTPASTATATPTVKSSK
jgi:type VII secretion protein EccB